MVFNTTFNNISVLYQQLLQNKNRGRRGRERMVVGFATTHAISAYHH
jgi:hypothetical protein